jgi:IS30 family transposase
LIGRKLSEVNKKNIGIANSVLFTEDQLNEIKSLRKNKTSYKEIAKQFNVSRSTITAKLSAFPDLKKININHVVFNNNQIEEIKKLRKKGVSFRELAKQFNCGYGTIQNKLNKRIM